MRRTLLSCGRVGFATAAAALFVAGFAFVLGPGFAGLGGGAAALGDWAAGFAAWA
jgi:hypothetical protein